MKRHTHCRQALTLLELVVVLLILAIIATIAINAVEPRVNAQRLQAASKLLDEIRLATLGAHQKYQVDGTPVAGGLMADVGCVPLGVRAIDLAEDGLPSIPSVLPELWDSNCSLALEYPFQFRTGPRSPVDYSEVRIPCGWRGPYLQLPVGSQRLVDPWGVPPQVISDNDGQAGVVQINVPPEVSPDEEPLAVDLAIGKVTVTGTILLDDGVSANVIAALLAPDPETSLTVLGVRADEDQEASTFLFSGVPLGFRAVVVDVGTRRQIKYIQVTRSGTHVVVDFRTPQVQ